MGKLRNLKNNIKWRMQRANRGFSDKDVWDIDVWFLDVMPKMLTQLKETTHSAPLLPNTDQDTCHEEWGKILDRMIFLLHEMDEDKCSFKNKYEKEYFEYLDKKFPDHLNDEEFDEQYKELRENYFRQEKIKAIHMDLRKTEFFDMFSRYFRDLWD